MVGATILNILVLPAFVDNLDIMESNLFCNSEESLSFVCHIVLCMGTLSNLGCLWLILC